jgi:hypothetical protein
MVHVYVQANTPNQWLPAQDWQNILLFNASLDSFKSGSNKSHKYLALTEPAQALIDSSLASLHAFDSGDLDDLFMKTNTLLSTIKLHLMTTTSSGATLTTPQAVPIRVDQSGCSTSMSSDIIARFQLADTVRPLFTGLLEFTFKLMDIEKNFSSPQFDPLLDMYRDVLTQTRDLFVSQQDLHLWKALANSFIQLQTLNSFRNTKGILCNLNTGTTRLFIISRLTKDEMDKRYLHNGVTTLTGDTLEKMKKFAQ